MIIFLRRKRITLLRDEAILSFKYNHNDLKKLDISFRYINVLSHLIFLCCYILVKLSAVDHKISRTYRKNVLLST